MIYISLFYQESSQIFLNCIVVPYPYRSRWRLEFNILILITNGVYIHLSTIYKKYLNLYRIFVSTAAHFRIGVPHRRAHRMALLIMAASVWLLCLAMATAKASQNPSFPLNAPHTSPPPPPLLVRPAFGKAVSNATQCNFINATTNDPQAGHGAVNDDDDAPLWTELSMCLPVCVCVCGGAL